MRIYFVKTDAGNEVAYTDGNMVTVLNYAPTGKLDGNIDLYADDAEEQCRKYFADHAACGDLNDYTDIAVSDAEYPFSEFIDCVNADNDVEATLIFNDGGNL